MTLEEVIIQRIDDCDVEIRLARYRILKLEYKDRRMKESRENKVRNVDYLDRGEVRAQRKRRTEENRLSKKAIDKERMKMATHQESQWFWMQKLTEIRENSPQLLNFSETSEKPTTKDVRNPNTPIFTSYTIDFFETKTAQAYEKRTNTITPKNQETTSSAEVSTLTSH